MSSTQTLATSHEHGECLEISEFRRLKYFYGQMLSPQDMQTEQNFFREKLRLHNRCLHGYGVVCGLLVKPVPFPEICETDAQKELRELEEERKRKTEKRTDKDNANLKREISEIEQKIEALKKKLCYEKPH